jgi:hypothetical protein
MLTPEQKRLVDEARGKDVLAEARARGAELRRCGSEWVGPCPVCGGTDRFGINPRKNVFICRQGGSAGDAVALVMYLDGAPFRAAVEALTGKTWPGAPSPRPSPAGGRGGDNSRAAEPASRGSADGQYRDAGSRSDLRGGAADGQYRDAGSRSDLRGGAADGQYRERERRRAWEIWQAGGPVAGSAVEAYLMARGIDLALAVRANRAARGGGLPLRCHPALPYWAPREDGTRGWRRIHQGPAMLAAITDGEGRFQGVHITWVDPDRPGRKAAIPHPQTGEILPAKKMRGSKARGAIRLIGPAAPPARSGHPPADDDTGPSRLVIGEGIETVLSVFLAERGSAAKADIRPPGAPSLTPGAQGRDCGPAEGRPRGAASQSDAGVSAYWSGLDLGHIGGRAAASIDHPTLTRTDAKGRVFRRRVPGPWPDPQPERDLPVPDGVTEILLLGDGDSDRFATEMHLRRAAARWAAPGRRIRIAWAEEGADFNDMLCDAVRASAANPPPAGGAPDTGLIASGKDDG